jgi:haloacetate dehalogenase
LSTADGNRGVCEDYRAGAFVDPEHDAADRAAGQRLAMPVLAVWKTRATCSCRSTPPRSGGRGRTTANAGLPGGHFLPEARPTDLADAIADLLTR